MKHFTKLLILLFFLPLFSVAQSNYRAGYVVTLKGDTSHGFIDYREWDKNPENINFKSSQNAKEAERFTTKNSLAFTITGFEYYERFILPISQDPVDINKLSSRLDTTRLTDTVFLRISAKGKYLTLYSYIDDIKPHFYLLEAGGTLPWELTFHAFYNQGELASVQYITRYRTQLENLAQKYNVNTDIVKEDILQSRYTEPDLIKVIQAINGGSSAQLTLQKLSGIRWFAGIGANYSDLKFEGDISLPDRRSTFPRMSAGIDFLPNKNIQRLFLRTEIAFTANTYNWNKNNYYFEPVTDFTSSMNIKQYTVSITPQIVYNIYNTGSFKIFVDVGMSFSYSSYNNYSYTENYGSFHTLVLNKYFPLDKVWESFLIKTGILLKKKLEVYIGYTPSAILSNGPNNINATGNVTSCQIGLNYLLGIK